MYIASLQDDICLQVRSSARFFRSLLLMLPCEPRGGRVLQGDTEELIKHLSAHMNKGE
jgi:hypothetical protein